MKMLLPSPLRSVHLTARRAVSALTVLAASATGAESVRAQPDAPSEPAAAPVAVQAAEVAPVPNNTIATLHDMSRLDNQQRLGVGDILSYRVVEDEEPPVALRINTSGEVEVPYLGLVKAEAKTCQQLAYDIKKRLQADLYHNATVIISIDTKTRLSPGKVYLTGQVARKGPVAIPADGDLYISQAIIEAGGMGEFADQRKVKLVRKTGTSDKDTKTYIIDVKDIIQNGRRDKDMLLKPGDWIIVPQRLFNF